MSSQGVKTHTSKAGCRSRNSRKWLRNSPLVRSHSRRKPSAKVDYFLMLPHSLRFNRLHSASFCSLAHRSPWDVYFSHTSSACLPQRYMLVCLGYLNCVAAASKTTFSMLCFHTTLQASANLRLKPLENICQGFAFVSWYRNTSICCNQFSEDENMPEKSMSTTFSNANGLNNKKVTGVTTVCTGQVLESECFKEPNLPFGMDEGNRWTLNSH